jgi:hypothetical protein
MPGVGRFRDGCLGHLSSNETVRPHATLVAQLRRLVSSFEVPNLITT